MIVFSIFLGLALVFLAVAGYRLVRPPHMATLEDFDTLCNVEFDRYGHLKRLLAPEDFQFLVSTRRGGALVPHLRRERFRIHRLYLEQMREEFLSLLSIGSLFAAAPTARAEKFARRLALVRLRFEWLVLRLRLKALASRLFGIHTDLVPLSEQIDSLRSLADSVLHRLTPQDMAHLRATLRSGS
jgi:hypothetical protein